MPAEAAVVVAKAAMEDMEEELVEEAAEEELVLEDYVLQASTLS
jgi:hypothetical protein